MKRPGTYLIIALFSFVPLCDARADLIERQFTQPGGTGSAGGIVFQGSRNMRGRSKKQGVVSSVVVPSLSPVTVIPALENKTLRPGPRFGYGSDYQPEAASARSHSVQRTSEAAVSAPVYLFRYTYPVYRDYLIRSPYSRYYSPFGGCRSHFSSGYTRFSLSFGW